MKENFGVAFTIAFLFSLTYFFFFQYLNPTDLTPFQKGFIKGLPRNYVVNIKDPWDANKTGVSWSTPGLYWDLGFNLADGIGIRTFDYQALFSELYPGYSFSLTKDREFIKSYYHSKMDSYTWLPILNTTSPLDNRLVTAPLKGCFELFRREGADILIFGDSEQALGLVPKLLKDSLQEMSPGKDLRVLNCTKIAIKVKLTALIAKILGESKRKAEIAVWRYGYWNYNMTREFSNNRNEIKQEIQLAGYGLLTNWAKMKLGDFFFRVSWPQPISLGIDLPYLNEKTRQKLNLGKEFNPRAAPAGTFDVAENLYGAKKILDSFSKSVPNTKDMTDVVEGKGCDMTFAAQELDTAIKALSNVAKKVYIYLSPNPPNFTSASPNCAHDALNRLLLSRANQNVQIKIDDWTKYGLSLSDYSFRTAIPGIIQVGSSHTNFSGATKVTHKIAEWIKEFTEINKVVKK